jgi:hypothetical protein
LFFADDERPSSKTRRFDVPAKGEGRPLMQRIFIGDNGDDNNDGLTPLTPIGSWQEYLNLKTGHDEIVILGGNDKAIIRLSEEISASAK